MGLVPVQLWGVCNSQNQERQSDAKGFEIRETSPILPVEATDFCGVASTENLHLQVEELKDPMSRPRFSTGLRAAAPLMLSAAALALLVAPGANAALPALGKSFVSGKGLATFTPANVDPGLAARVARDLAAKGQTMRFTPSGGVTRRDESVTVAVRVDRATAQAIAVRNAGRTLATLPGTGARMAATGAEPAVAIAPTRYNLGAARGYNSFARRPVTLAGVNDAKLPDLARLAPSTEDRPSRLQPRIAIEDVREVGRAPRTLQGAGEPTMDVGGAYRVTRNLDVTAGVRVSQDRDRLAPLTDAAADNQAVYVGTQFRF